MSTQIFTPEFKEEAVKQVRDRGYGVPEVAARIGVSAHSLYKWVKAASPDKSEQQSKELLDGEIYYSLREARIVIESWRRHYNTVRPHESLGYKPPAPEAFLPAIAARAAPQPRPAAPPALVPRPSMN